VLDGIEVGESVGCNVVGFDVGDFVVAFAGFAVDGRIVGFTVGFRDVGLVVTGLRDVGRLVG
jgi:hypothetical protein